MAVQRKPKKQTTEKAASAFIDGSAPKAKPANQNATKALKKPVAMRFDPVLLARIDKAAERMGVSRNAWVSLRCAEALEE